MIIYTRFITQYYNEHIKNIQIFTVCVFWDVDEETNYKISIPNRISFASDVDGYQTTINETACDFSNRISTTYLSPNFSPKRIHETKIILISDLKDMIFHHYLELPKSMICPKLSRRFHQTTEVEIYDFENKWLLDPLKR